MSLRIKKNDRVQVIDGQYKGMVSRVLYMVPEKDQAFVENVNMRKRHMKRRSQNQPTGIVEKEGAIHVSNILLYCEKCKAGVRFGTKTGEDGKEKQRICRKCGTAL